MVGPLPRFHFHQQGGDDGPIYKPDIPLVIVVDRSAQIALRCDLVDDLILRVKNVEDQQVVLISLFRWRLLLR